jgi:hypothetical protein
MSWRVTSRYMSTKPVRLDRVLADRLRRRADAEGRTLPSELKLAVKAHLQGKPVPNKSLNIRKELTSHGDPPSNAEPTPKMRRGCNFTNELTSTRRSIEQRQPEDEAPSLRDGVK